MNEAPPQKTSNTLAPTPEKVIAAALALVITSLWVFLLGVFATTVLETYSITLFVFLPLCSGATSTLIYNRSGRREYKDSMAVALFTGVFSLALFIMMGAEGMICLLMAAPLALPLFLAGGVLGYFLARLIRQKRARDITMLLIMLIAPFGLGFETRHQRNLDDRAVVSSVTIDGDVADVWREVIAFSPIPEPQEIAFRAGIAYPTHAEIKGTGVGAIRYCHFSTGAFVEPITVWDENKRLAFDVSEQPDPMIEVSPWGAIKPPHLDWAVRSSRGQFVLRPLDDGRVELIGTTWYRVNIHPVWYWGAIGDECIHMIHMRVLEHIKTAVEARRGGV